MAVHASLVGTVLRVLLTLYHAKTVLCVLLHMEQSLVTVVLALQDTRAQSAILFHPSAHRESIAQKESLPLTAHAALTNLELSRAL